LPDDAARGLAALRRFQSLITAMGIAEWRCVATAAVREAANGGEFIAAAREIGVEIELLTGTQEAQAAGFGVISAIPDAHGIAADLGGGSLELAHVRGGMVHQTSSFPLGVLRLAAMRAGGEAAVKSAIRKALRKAGWPGDAGGMPLYLVGGSWRALSRLDMELTRFALPVMDHHDMPPSSITRLLRATRRMSFEQIRAIPGMSAARASAIPDAALLLSVLVRQLGTSGMVISSSGLREGLLYQALGAEERAQDPLLVAAAHEGRRLGRFAAHGALLDSWIAPLFGDDDPAMARLRLAACYLSDVAWTANPDFRAERGMEIALHGNWRGIDVPGRLILARALHAGFGGIAREFPAATGLADPASMARASQWGLAIRLGQRLSAGLGGPLEASRLTVDDGILNLHLFGWGHELAGESVDRRLRQLAMAMGLLGHRVNCIDPN
jgi:exopolyphosphatase/guanosine-5'-triphosphate,3'-diphosphate pyrophosphatase